MPSTMAEHQSYAATQGHERPEQGTDGASIPEALTRAPRNCARSGHVSAPPVHEYPTGTAAFAVVTAPAVRAIG